MQAHYVLSHLHGTATSYFDFKYKNNALHLNVNIKNNAVVNFHQVSFKQFTPHVGDSAAIVIYRESLENLMHY